MAHKKSRPWAAMDPRASRGGNPPNLTPRKTKRDYNRFPLWKQFYNATKRRPASDPQVIYLQGLRARLGLNVWNRLKAELGIKTPGTWGLSFVEAHVLIQSCIEILEGESL